MDSKRRQIFLVLILALAVFGAYFKVLKAEFVYDDIGFIVNNEAIKTLIPFSKFLLSPSIFTGSKNQLEANNWRPVSSLAFALEYYFFGPNPLGFHLVGILLHLLNLVLVYFLIFKLTGRSIIALLASALWALHPALTEAVSWASNQSTLFFFAFFLISAILLFKYEEGFKKNIWLWASYLFFSFSLLSKETALGGVLVMALISAIYIKKKVKPGFFKEFTFKIAPYFLISIFYFVVRYKILGVVGDHVLRGSFWQNLLLAPAVFSKYLSLSVWPINLLLDYTNFVLPQTFWDPRVIMGILLMAFLVWLFWFSFKKSQFNISIGLLWFFAFLAPVLQIIPFQDIIGERFLYAPLVGFFLALILGFNKAIAYVKARFNVNLNKVSAAALALVLSTFFVLTFNRNNDWLNSENLWLSVLKIDARNERALQNLSAFYLGRGEALKIIEFSNRLVLIYPENKAGRLHLSVGKILNGQYEEAESELLDLIKKYPDFKEAKNNLSVLYKQLGRRDGAIQSIIVSPQTEDNVITSGILGRIFLNVMPYEASLDVFSAQGLPVISIRSHSNGAFQIPLKPGFYRLVPLDPDGPVSPVRDDYNFMVNSGEWLDVKIEYK